MQREPSTTAPAPATTLRDFFARTYVVNLPHRTDRRRLMVRELQRIGLPETPGRVEFFPAVRPTDAGPFTSVGVRGCYLSHLSILRSARDAGLRNVLVLEDDLETSPAIRAMEASLVRYLADRRWDLAYFFRPGGRPAGTSVAEGEPFVTTTEPVKGAHFYAVNGPALGQVVAFLDQVLTRPSGDPCGGPMHYDGALNTFRAAHPDAVALVTTVDLSGQRGSRSDIADGPWYDRAPVVRSIATVARHLKYALKPK